MRPVFLCVLIYVYGSRTLLNLGVRILTLRVYLLHSSEYSLTAEAINFFFTAPRAREGAHATAAVRVRQDTLGP